jgi:hypothetical protein
MSKVLIMSLSVSESREWEKQSLGFLRVGNF